MNAMMNPLLAMHKEEQHSPFIHKDPRITPLSSLSLRGATSPPSLRKTSYPKIASSRYAGLATTYGGGVIARNHPFLVIARNHPSLVIARSEATKQSYLKLDANDTVTIVCFRNSHFAIRNWHILTTSQPSAITLRVLVYSND
jgi:hypothetical protein